jgi:hypothetical protein
MLITPTGKPPEHMTASVAAQQKKYNPLIKLLGTFAQFFSEWASHSRTEDDELTSQVFRSKLFAPTVKRMLALWTQIVFLPI